MKQIQAINETMEKNLVEAKMNWAELDMENEEMSHKYKQKCD
jgi:hypothetical protein